MSRTFGDILSKKIDGKIMNGVSAEPEIIQIDLVNLDFLLLCSDGVYG